MSLTRVTTATKSKTARRHRAIYRIGGVLGVVLFVMALTQGQTGEVPRASTYPISGYFIASSNIDSKNLQKLQEIQALGGDTVITFGTSLLPAALDALPQDCTIKGENCARVAASGLKVNRYFTFSDGSQWGPPAIKCPRDRHVINEGKAYTVMVFPANDPGCKAKDGKYDVIVAGGSPTSAVDPTVSVAAAASTLGMEFYAGLPAPAKRTDVAYLPDLTYIHTMERFTERFLQYHAAVNDVSGLAGFYHHTEMPVSTSPVYEPVLSLYTMQNGAIHKLLPTRSAIVSPYIEARRDASSIDPAEARGGARKIAQTASGLHLSIAIQDGMGTGKGAAHSASEAKQDVDKFAASIVGKGSWEEKYVAPNRNYFAAAAEGVKGTGADLWANLEGMAPATEANPCDKSLRGQTTVARIERQLQEMASVTKVISYMWDPYYTCDGKVPALKKEMEGGFTVPLVTGSSFDAATGELRVLGFNLRGNSLRISWTGTDGEGHEMEAQPTGIDSAYGKDHGLNPRIQLAVLKMDAGWTNPGDAYVLSAKNTPD
ncbi:hypothetical protein [Paenarthrobacter ureafaciens]|uniref:hypothetical protein n=1 Tax=Paenarthrobacter ureafaciens TaxID=37931 RepID=UPI00140E6757|nr:hypothetical protein [Paenarthrobacter ureafaciens]MCX8456782.1 hypothetical protein [Paenarthrobacter ureafaciens]MCY0972630.1 hypothetical protein [Paenarthrobacter ureafaciens]QQQ61667.1 hypothetical protein JHQ56_15525 [Paenarthrobacter ureafaciens]